MSTLDTIIDPEVHQNTQMYHVIQQYLKTVPVHTIIEIGASSGGGTTEALIQGVLNGCTPPQEVKMASIEVSRTRFGNLATRYEHVPFFTPYNTSSLPLSRFPTADQVREFCRTTGVFGDGYEGVIDWLEADVKYVKDNHFDENGIARIKADFEVETFDLACIDASEFLGWQEFLELPGCNAYILDDIHVHKNYLSHRALLNHPEYVLLFEEKTRGGTSLFCKRSIASKYFGMSF